MQEKEAQQIALKEMVDKGQKVTASCLMKNFIMPFTVMEPMVSDASYLWT